MSETNASPGPDFGPRRLSVELTNICNLHCSYCLRDDDALYHTPANFISPEFLDRLAGQAREVMGITALTFTGGEPTLHPQFARLLEILEAHDLKCSFVTNGWHFERVWPAVLAHRDSIPVIAFSLDGPTREEHDRWRGEGSFTRLVRAFSLCFMSGIRFNIKVSIRRDTVPHLERIAIFAARIGASILSFSHVMPTSTKVEDVSALSFEERTRAEQEIASLSRIFKMKIGIDVGYYNLDPSPPCSALAGVSANVDYLGRLTLCCNLSGFRGALGEGDVVADLHKEDLASAYSSLARVMSGRLEERKQRLEQFAEQGIAPDLDTGSPCLFCLNTLGKLPWHQPLSAASAAARSLPVLPQS